MRHIYAFLLLFSSSYLLAQPHPYGCQHWRTAGGNAAVLNTDGVRALNASIARSDTFDVLHYDIAIDICDYSGQTIKAETAIQFVAKMDGQSNIRFDLVRLTVDSVKQGSELLPFETDSEHVNVFLSTQMAVGDTEEVRIYYHGHPYQDPVWGGFYFESGYIYNLGIGLSTIPPNFGKVWYPCFDSFVERATYMYHVKSAGTFRAHCQGDFLGETALGGDTVIRNYSFNQPLPTHLSAIAASDYRSLTFNHPGAYGPVPVTLNAKPADTTMMRNKFSSLGAAIDACQFWYGPTGWPGVGYSLTTDGALEITGNIAYPQFMMGQPAADNRNLYAHELGHFWWGNWIAPYNHNDMWLKEGPAEYSGHLTAEWEEGHDAFIKEVKDNHVFVLKTAHISDGGYLALSPMPDAQIYGDHTYYKGASVMHNLRGYLGDTLFRQAMSAVQNAHPYETMTPDLFRQYLEAGSGVSLDDFFDDQVYKPGFAAFVVDSFAATPAGNGWSVEINVLQKLHECPSFYGNVPLDVTLVSANRERRDYVLTANGQFTQWTIESDIEPVMVILNGYNRLNQARTDFEAVYAPGATVVNGILPYGEFRLYLDSLPDTTLFRVDHIWSAPDSSLRNEGIYQFSSTHYWHVDGVWPTDAQMHAQLSYVGNTTTSLDNDLFDVDENNAVLIYREKAASPWKVYSDYTLVAGALTNGLGTIKIDVLRKGDYAFANGDQTIGIFDLMEKESSVVIFPNPVNDQLSIQFESTTKGKKIVSIFNDLGQLVKRTEIISNASTNVEKLNVSELMQGNYIVHVLDLHSQQSKSAQFQIVR